MRHDSSGTLAGWENIDGDVGQDLGAVSALGETLTRSLDIIVAAALLVLLAPVILIVAAAIKLESAGPAFYRCPRVGRSGRAFHMLKFRTMHDGPRGPALASWEDDGFTRMGPFLVGTKPDELPLLWSVLRGRMGLVRPGPGPARSARVWGLAGSCEGFIRFP